MATVNIADQYTEPGESKIQHTDRAIALNLAHHLYHNLGGGRNIRVNGNVIVSDSNDKKERLVITVNKISL